MFLKNYQTIFMVFLSSGTFIAVSANSWFTAWVGLEVNLMSLIPLILNKLNSTSTEAAIKYFMAQAMASILLITMSLVESSSLQTYLISNSSTLMLVALSIKAGMAPFHYWFPQVVFNAPWPQAFLILVWQKIAPFSLMTYFHEIEMMSLVVTTSAMVGAMGGINQSSFKMIMTYSSIAHSSWMMALCSISMSSWASYFLVYSMITATLILLVSFLEIKFIKNISTAKMSPAEKMTTVMVVLSLAGLPPMLGFTAKLMAVILIIKFLPLFLTIILAASSIISLFYYMKLAYTLMLKSSQENKIFKNKHSIFLNSFMALAVFGNLLVPQLVLLT